MIHEDPSCTALLERAGRGCPEAAGELFMRHRERLRRMVRIRLDHRLQGRLDPSDVIQETYMEFSRSLADYLRSPSLPFFLWLRYLTGMKLQALHRNHLGVKGRDARREVSLHVGMLPQASSVSLAAHLSGSTPRPVKRRSRGVAASHPGCPELGVA